MEKLIVKSQLSFDGATQLAEGVQSYERRSPEGSIIENRIIEIRFYLFYKRQFESLVRALGFEVAALYGDYDYKSYEEE